VLYSDNLFEATTTTRSVNVKPRGDEQKQQSTVTKRYSSREEEDEEEIAPGSPT